MLNQRITDNIEQVANFKAELLGSFLYFTETFFPLVTGREFAISKPFGRESHFITIAKELTRVKRCQQLDTLINTPPGSGKSTLVSMWVAWCMADYPDSNFLYISYSKALSAKHTEFIRRILNLSDYKSLFGVKIRHDSKAKDSFQTEQGGSIKAFGSSGAITGQDAGLPNQERFSGAVIIDDAHKPDEVHSDTIRESVIQNYRETILQRPRGPNVPIIFIGQRLHEADLPAFMMSGNDERIYRPVILKSIDDAGNALYPEVNPLESLLEKKEKNTYVFASQYQQDPIPAGGALYKADNFLLLNEEPKILTTFITADTAETSKSYNDATVFSFWGVYEIEEFGQKTGDLGLHWLDCVEIRIEPKELRDQFLSFYGDCVTHKVRPRIACIEKKSTGVTLISTLEDMRGLEIREVKRTKADGSKAARFLEMQPLIASKLVTFTKGAKHVDMCINHMIKITANDSHRWDDVCFVANTKVATIYGYKNIQDIRVGDKVITPFGVGNVKACGPTGKHKTVENIGLKGTYNHPVYTDDGFKSLDTICDDVKINHLSFGGLLKWKYLKILFLMESSIDSWGRDGIILVSKKTIKNDSVLKDFMSQFGSFIQKRKLKKGMLFTIRMATILITTSVIWSVFLISNTWRNILRANKPTADRKKTKETLQKQSRNQKNGIEAKRVFCGIVKTLKQAYVNLKNIIAKCAEKILSPTQQKPLYAASFAVAGLEERNLKNLQETALYATNNLSQKNLYQEAETEKHAPLYVDEDIVYNLSVDCYGVYYANGVLVSNCDTCYDAVKMALIDKVIYEKGLDIKNDIVRDIARDFQTKNHLTQRSYHDALI